MMDYRALLASTLVIGQRNGKLSAIASAKRKSAITLEDRRNLLPFSAPVVQRVRSAPGLDSGAVRY